MAFAAAFGGGLGGYLAGEGASAATHNIITAALRSTNYFANAVTAMGVRAPILSPTDLILSPDQLIHLWISSNWTSGDLTTLMAWHGIDINRDSWRDYINTRQTAPDLAVLIALKQLGRMPGVNIPGFREMTPDQLYEYWVRRYGYKEPVARQLLLQKPHIFTPEESRILYRLTASQGEGYPTRADRAVYNQRLSAAGMPDSRDREQFEKLIQPPTYKECIDLLNRDLLLKRPQGERQATQADREREFERLMALEGFTDPQIIKYLRSLAQEFPTESELIDMSVKNVFSAHLSKILQLDDEYEEQPQYIVWTDRRGLSGSPTISRDAMRQHMLAHNQIVKDAGQPGEDEDTVRQQADQYYDAQDKTLLSWAQAFWREHWINVSPSQIYICLHRLRPVDTTKPGGVQAKQRYEEELARWNLEYNANAEQLAALQADEAHGGNSAERARLHARQEEIVVARYAIAVRYSRQWGRVQFVPGSTEPVPPVTMDVVRTVLRANDYAPRFRDSLAAISYNVLRLVDIRRIVQQSLRDPAFAARAIGWGPLPTSQFEGEELSLVTYVRAWAREQFLDRGQTPDSATVLAELSVVQGRQANTVIARATNPAGRRRYVRLLDKAISIGLIDREAYNRYMERIDVRGGDGAAEVQISADVYSDDLTAQDVSEDSQWQIAFSEEESVAVAEDLFDSGDFGEV